MSHSVYGIRLKGDVEVRYVGLTRHSEKWRLRQHFYMNAGRCGASTPFGIWLHENRANVEVFQIWEAETSDQGLVMERGTIEMCTRLGHRLFNRQHVPAESCAQAAA